MSATFKLSVPLMLDGENVSWKEVDAIAVDDVWCVHEHVEGGRDTVLTHRPTGLSLGYFSASLDRVFEAAGTAPPVSSLGKIKVTPRGTTGKLSKADIAKLEAWRAQIDIRLRLGTPKKRDCP